MSIFHGNFCTWFGVSTVNDLLTIPWIILIMEDCYNFDNFYGTFLICRLSNIMLYWVFLSSGAHFLSLARSNLRLCSANHRPGYWSNLSCDWPSTAWAYSEQEIENGVLLTLHIWQAFQQHCCHIGLLHHHTNGILKFLITSIFGRHLSSTATMLAYTIP